jgi:bifunctional DNA-binding transcriptional regulator/antitoxin component of YhaV-PrlF toxin-antitoxin module
MAMNATEQADTVWFTPKGQVVIPLRLRKLYHLEDGTRALVTSTDEGILLQPVTRHAINRLRGILKRKPDDKPFAEQWTERQREEKELEERRYARGASAR